MQPKDKIMKALTLYQPWATLVAIGAKRIETRSWKTDYRGPLAIHAAIGNYVDDYLLMKIEPFYSALRSAGIEYRTQIPLGGILAICELVKCVRINRVSQLIKLSGGDFEVIPPVDPELSFGDYTPGRYAWILRNVSKLSNPIPAKGAMRLWNWGGEAKEV